MCMNLRNKFIIRQHLEFPTLEIIFALLSNAKWFTVLEASSPFYQIPLDERSSDLCTFITEFGQYKFKRLLYGLYNLIDGIDGTLAYIDNILIYGSSIFLIF